MLVITCELVTQCTLQVHYTILGTGLGYLESAPKQYIPY